jgi:iron complex transport system permease protein
VSRRLTLWLGAQVAALFVVSLVTGPAAIGPLQGLWALIAGGDGPAPMIMREIRLPRALLGAAVGAGLGLAGAALQGYLRNPLAEPGLIGVGGAAALGAVLAIQSGAAAAFVLGLPLAALAGAGVAAGLVLWLAGPRGGSITLILAGIAISSFAGRADGAGAVAVAEPVRGDGDHLLDDGLAGRPFDDPCGAGRAVHPGGCPRCSCRSAGALTR